MDAILKLLPAEKSPTVAPLADEQYVAIEIIISEKDGRELIPRRAAGLRGGPPEATPRAACPVPQPPLYGHSRM